MFAFLFGFGCIWHIVWLIVVSLVGAIVAFLIRSADNHTEYEISAAEVERIATSREQTV
jgi:cytochrome o ubiquinol oxidase subunit 1